MSGRLREDWYTEYAAEHAEVRRQKELCRRRYIYQSPQLQFRSFLVNWVRMVSERLKLCSATVHLTVYLMDIFMDNHAIEVDRLHLVTLVCLQVAAKYEERDLRIPKITDLNSLVNNRYQTCNFQELEIMVMRFLDWNLDHPTASHFAEYYSLFAVSKADWDVSECSSYENFWYIAQQAVKDYLDLSLTDGRMHQFLPSTVACACILLARQQLRFPVKWTEELQEVTRYKVDDLLLCANTILSNTNIGNQKRKLVDSPDHGYDTGSSSKGSPSPDGVPIKRRAPSNRKSRRSL